ncbi:bifunctional riboflavin kinase/FAD synthetase [Aestuariispira ectoiniformans]|uniref:bifunctional riboflavin kinase/FAD synthetase n=1 Tax=Aestuariispira ectoiniformans TaxID=2775080 RepID=UPI00223C4AAF|nr:bifunctional riboflavin kinase/FAD synthetase [Aestuariispira ectoiniformans]
MQIVRDRKNIPSSAKGGVVVIGNFDGVHRGHQAVIGQAADLAEAVKAPLVVLTFEPHPRSYFRPDDTPFRLTPFQNKAHHLEALDVDVLVALDFGAELAGMEAEDFVRQILVAGLDAAHVVVGYDFCFGKGRTGTPDKLREWGGFPVTTISPVASADEEVYSSTRIRDYLRTGRPGLAAALLGRPFEIEGEVNTGRQLGRTIGFPTANVGLDDYLRPLYGVYAVRLGLEQGDGHVGWYDAIANLGNRPTVDGVQEQLEVHIFDFDQDLYGKVVRVALIEFIRPEQKFDGLEALKAQIEEDCHVARRILHTRAAGA